MNELLKAWYTDSSPGNGANPASKCGEKLPATGISGTSTISAPITGVDVTTLGGRATGTPGSTLPSTPAGRAPYWSFAALATVWFDGFSALYNLPTTTDSGNFSMSFWYNPWSEPGDRLAGPGQDPIVFGSPSTTEAPVDPGSGVAMDGTQYFDVASTSLSASRPLDARVPASGAAWGGAGYNMGSDFVTDPIGDMQGWCHVMFAVQVSGGVASVTMWINDTNIATAVAASDANTFPNIPFSAPDFTDANGYDHFWNIGGRPDRLGAGSHDVIVFGYENIGLSVPSNVPAAGTPIQGAGYNNATAVSLGSASGTETNAQAALAAGYASSGGGVSFTDCNAGSIPGTKTIQCLGHPVLATVSANLQLNTDDCTTIVAGTWEGFIRDRFAGNRGFEPRAGEGLQGAVTEMWIAPGQFIDWSVLANRYKFQTSDDPTGVSPSHWAPVDLGPAGKLPTGIKPLVYLTGPPAQFNLNRARSGKSLSLFRNSVGGLVGQLLAYFKVPL